MNSFYQQALDNQKKMLEELAAVQSAFFQGYQKLLQLNWQALETQFEDTRHKTQSATQARDPHEAFEFTATLAQPNVEAMLAYSDQAREIISAMQAEMTRLCSDHVSQQQQRISDAMVQISRQAAGAASSITAQAGSSTAGKPSKNTNKA